MRVRHLTCPSFYCTLSSSLSFMSLKNLPSNHRLVKCAGNMIVGHYVCTWILILILQGMFINLPKTPMFSHHSSFAICILAFFCPIKSMDSNSTDNVLWTSEKFAGSNLKMSLYTGRKVLPFLAARPSCTEVP